jgi:hypothetical protein
MTAISETFYGAVPEQPREDVLADYLRFLEARNGSVATSGAYPRREEWLGEADQNRVRFAGEIDADAFERGFTALQPGTDAALLSLLAFVKVNAGEAYGVEVVTKRRHGRPARGVFEQVERVLGNEEQYHTRILLGATHQFGLAPPKATFRPPLPLRILIGTLAYSPKALFHPVLLGSELAGVFTFNWMLQKVGVLFADQPALRDSLESRLVEILIDEVGHVAFNRLAVGPWGMSAARVLAAKVAEASSQITPELAGLGWGKATLHDFEKFDFAMLPAEVRRRSFFA